MFKRISIVLTLLSAAAPAKADRQQTLDRMRANNQLYQIYLGRGGVPAELKASVNSTRVDLQRQLGEKKEFAELFQCRVQAFVKGGNSVQGVTTCKLDYSVDANVSLNDVLKPFERKKHPFCAKGTDAECFAAWLVDQVAPVLKNQWLSANKARLQAVSYTELLSMISE